MHDVEMEKYAIALDLCEKIGAIEESEFRSGEYIDTSAYSDYEKLTDNIIKEYPDSINSFDNREDMLEHITSALDSAGVDRDLGDHIEDFE